MTPRTPRMTLKQLVLFATGFVLSGAALAADIAITGGRVFTGVEDGARERAAVVVSDGRIVSVSDDAAPAEAATVIDASGLTVMPGLIDTHVHLFFDLMGQGPAFPVSDEEADAYAADKMPADLENYLDNGFTTLLSAIDFWPHILTVRERLDSGEIRGPRLLAAGGALMAPGWHYICGRLEGEPKAWCNEHVAVQIDSPQSAAEAVERYVASGVNAIVYDALTNNAAGVDPAIAGAVVESAHSAGLPVLVHNADTAGFGVLTGAGIDGFIHPPGGTLDPAGSQWRGISGQVPNGLVLGITTGETEEAIRNGQRTEEQITAYGATRANVQYLLSKGAMPVYASDIPGGLPAYTRPIVIRSLIDLGLSPAEVLQAATINAARALRMDDEIGSLEAGKRADILVVRGNPLNDPNAVADVVLVIQDGKVVVDNR